MPISILPESVQGLVECARFEMDQGEAYFNFRDNESQEWTADKEDALDDDDDGFFVLDM